MPLKIQIHPLAEPLTPKIACQHTDHFSPFFIDGGGIEIVDLTIAFRTNGMRGRAPVLGKLRRAQHADIAGTLHPLIMHVSREKLITVNSQSLFKGQLEPVAAGHPVTGPVMKILMRHDGFDIVQISVGGGAFISQYIFAVENIEAFILHRPHVEMADGNNLKQIKIIFETEPLLIPFHRFFQRLHSMTGQIDIALFDIDMQVDMTL